MRILHPRPPGEHPGVAPPERDPFGHASRRGGAQAELRRGELDERGEVGEGLLGREESERRDGEVAGGLARAVEAVLEGEDERAAGLRHLHRQGAVRAAGRDDVGGERGALAADAQEREGGAGGSGSGGVEMLGVGEVALAPGARLERVEVVQGLRHPPLGGGGGGRERRRRGGGGARGGAVVRAVVRAARGRRARLEPARRVRVQRARGRGEEEERRERRREGRTREARAAREGSRRARGCARARG